ncbi:hypothetical protein SAMN05444161_8859 [Rhizobiales bacterium GAS191]|nr:hypothetical protein SAMN05444161_8859 [Rhizobiales bacterium GAS191]
MKGKQQAITAAQCRAARGLIEMSQLDLARAAVLTSSIVIDFENGASTPQRANLDAMRRALES